MGFTQSTYRFTNLRPDQIARFDLQAQTRTFETIEFRNVSLYPGRPTKVEIVRLPASESATFPQPTFPLPTGANEDTIQPGQVLIVRAMGVLPYQPIADRFRVEPSGKIALGPAYGRTPPLTGMTLEQAEKAIRAQLAKTVEDPRVMVTRPIDSRARLHILPPKSKIQPGDILQIHVIGTPPDLSIAGLFRVEASGNVPLGPAYGRVKISGLTFEQAEAAITKHLGKILDAPLVQVTEPINYTPSPDELR